MPAAMASLPVGTRASIVRRNCQAVDLLGDQGVDQLDLLSSIGGSRALVQYGHAQFFGSFLSTVVGGVKVGVAEVFGHQDKGHRAGGRRCSVAAGSAGASGREPAGQEPPLGGRCGTGAQRQAEHQDRRQDKEQ